MVEIGDATPVPYKEICLKFGELKERDARLTYLNHFKAHYPGCTLVEAGTAVLLEVPPSIANLSDGAAMINLAQLPRILASADDYIASADGMLHKTVEYKVVTPYVPHSNGQFRFKADIVPHDKLKVEYFAQVQFQMLVKDLDAADFVSHAPVPGGLTNVFHVQRDNEWCNMALQLLQYFNVRYVQRGEAPPPDPYLSDPAVQDTYIAFLERTVELASAAAANKHQLPSLFNHSCGRTFLDGLPPEDPLFEDYPLPWQEGTTRYQSYCKVLVSASPITTVTLIQLLLKDPKTMPYHAMPFKSANHGCRCSWAPGRAAKQRGS